MRQSFDLHLLRHGSNLQQGTARRHECNWLQQAFQASRLQVPSDGQWLADPEATEQIVFTPHGTVRLISRERLSPADRGIVPFDVFQGVPARVLAHPLNSAESMDWKFVLVM